MTILLDAQFLLNHIENLLNQQTDEGVAETLLRLRAQDLEDTKFQLPTATQKPVVRFLPTTLLGAKNFDATLADAMLAISSNLCWQQSASYSDEILGIGFSENYAWAEFIGANGFFPGDDFVLGVLLLGPQQHYLDHYHPAPELYWPLTAPSQWKKGNGDFMPRQQGEIIWHPSGIVHATKTSTKPLLAIYVWTKDVATPARLSILDS